MEYRKLIRNEGINLPVGSLCVVLPMGSYGEQYRELLKVVGYTGMKDFICIDWIEEGRSPNGYYHSCRFDKIKERVYA